MIEGNQKSGERLSPTCKAKVQYLLYEKWQNGKVQIKVNFTDGPLKTISGNPRMILSITKPNSGD